MDQPPVVPPADAPPPAPKPARRFPPMSTWLRWRERGIEAGLLFAALLSIFVTAGIVFILLYESSTFFSQLAGKRGGYGAAFSEFFTDRLWTPLFADAHFGILPLVCGTLVTTLVALCVALPVGTVVAIYLSEY